MKIPSDAVIPRDKLTKYLLVFQPENDKSQFLAQAGFTQDNSELARVIKAGWCRFRKRSVRRWPCIWSV